MVSFIQKMHKYAIIFNVSTHTRMFIVYNQADFKYLKEKKYIGIGIF